MSITRVENKSQLILALEMAQFDGAAETIKLGTFEITTMAVTEAGPWQQSCYAHKVEALERLIKRIKRMPAKLFKV